MSRIAAIVTKCDSSAKVNVICWLDCISAGAQEFKMLEAFRDKYYPKASVQLLIPNFIENEVLDEDRLHIKLCEIDGVKCSIICDDKTYKFISYRKTIPGDLIKIICQNNECMVV